MHTATVTLKSVSGSLYQPSAPISTPRPDKISHEVHEQNTWRERGHYLPNGTMIIPGVSFKRALEAASAYNPRKLKGNATFKALFERAVIVADPLVLSEKKDEVIGTPIFVPSDGVSSSKSTTKSPRVWKTFPTVQQWEGQITFHVLDDRVTENVFIDTLKDAGLYIGVGSWRPQRGGLNGRFEVVKTVWK